MFDYKNKLKQTPKKPGVYQFLDHNGQVLYIGKAKNLKARLGQYFSGNDHRPQIPFLLKDAMDISYTVLTNELESLYLENTLIKQYLPKYNILLRDDKNYAFIKIDYSTEIPQIGYARKVEQLNPKPLALSPKYFGPYSAAYKIRNTLNLTRRIFSYCASEKVGTRPCFYYYMHRCPGVCIGKMSLEDYHKHLEKIVKFLQGDTTGAIAGLKKEMLQASHKKKFETAARLRDQLRALELLNQKQNVIFTKKVDWDIFSVSGDQETACVNLFKVRGGKMFDKENFIYGLPPMEPNSQINQIHLKNALESLLERYYLETSSVPQEIFLQFNIESTPTIANLIKKRFKKSVKITVPKKGQNAKLIRLGQTNAEAYLKNWLSDKAGNLDKINLALADLKQILQLKQIPKRIECYDISNTQGTNPVGSMVVFENGLPKKSEYRKFKIRSKTTPDDFAMMKEMLSRRLNRLLNTGLKIKDTWPVPDLIVIDGGKGQLNVALSVLKAKTYNLKTLPVIGLAKRIEEIFTPENTEPIILPHNQPALQLLQRLRDEAHRFGITFHRQLRSKAAVKSALDEISGIGPKTKKLLKTKFGTISEIKKAPSEELEKLIGKKLAKALKENL